MSANPTPLRFLLVAIAAATLLAAAGDRPGTSDHPLVSRYPGSVIANHYHADYEQHWLPLSTPKTIQPEGLEKILEVEGAVTRIAYEVEKGASSLQVYRNFTKALEDAGFDELYACDGEACGYPGFWQRFFPGAQTYGDQETQHYSANKIVRAGAEAYVGIYTGQRRGGQVQIGLDIVETREFDSDLISIDPETLANELLRSGRATLEGIHFDFNEATITPDSAPALEAAATVLTEHPSWSLYIVGHTDDVGDVAYNLTLSKRRAAAVVDALATRGIDAKRLTSFGAGPHAPIATNETEQGRAENRRVELVKRLEADR